MTIIRDVTKAHATCRNKSIHICILYTYFWVVTNLCANTHPNLMIMTRNWGLGWVIAHMENHQCSLRKFCKHPWVLMVHAILITTHMSIFRGSLVLQLALLPSHIDCYSGQCCCLYFNVNTYNLTAAWDTLSLVPRLYSRLRHSYCGYLQYTYTWCSAYQVKLWVCKPLVPLELRRSGVWGLVDEDLEEHGHGCS